MPAGFGIRLNQAKPNIYFKRHDKGGIQLHVQLASAPTYITPGAHRVLVWVGVGVGVML